MSIISDSNYYHYATGDVVEGGASPSVTNINTILKVFQAAINDNFSRITGLNSGNVDAVPVAGLSGATILAQIQALFTLAQALPWANIANKPTTLAGYGITDGALKTHIHPLTVNGDVFGSVTLDDVAKTVTLTLAPVGVAGTYMKVTVDSKGRITSGSVLTAADIPNLTLAKITDAGTAASKNTGLSVGNVPVLEAGGLLNPAVVPIVSQTTTFVVASQAAMLATGARVGDLSVRTDVSKTFILQTLPATVVGNWIELPSSAPVSSVAGRTGVVVLAASDVGLANVTNESKATMFTNSTLTGTTTGVNWVGKLNGKLITVATTAPSTPSLNDVWLDLTAISWKYWDGDSWEPVGGSGGSSSWASITGKPTTFAGFGITDNFAEKVTVLPTANVGNRARIVLLQGVDGVAEVASLTLSAGSGSTSNVTVTLNGVAQNVPVLSTDNTATLVATKIRAATFAGWTTGGSGTTVTFTSTTKGIKTDATYSPGSTGANGTMTTPTQGVDSTPDETYICKRLGDEAYDWKQIDL